MSGKAQSKSPSQAPARPAQAPVGPVDPVQQQQGNYFAQQQMLAAQGATGGKPAGPASGASQDRVKIALGGTRPAVLAFPQAVEALVDFTQAQLKAFVALRDYDRGMGMASGLGNAVKAAGNVLSGRRALEGITAPPTEADFVKVVVVALQALAAHKSGNRADARKLLLQAHQQYSVVGWKWGAYKRSVDGGGDATRVLVELSFEIAVAGATAGATAGLQGGLLAKAATKAVVDGAPKLVKRAATEAEVGGSMDWGTVAFDTIAGFLGSVGGGVLSQKVAGLVASQLARRTGQEVAHKAVARAIASWVTKTGTSAATAAIKQAQKAAAGKRLPPEEFAPYLARQFLKAIPEQALKQAIRPKIASNGS